MFQTPDISQTPEELPDTCYCTNMEGRAGKFSQKVSRVGRGCCSLWWREIWQPRSQRQVWGIYIHWTKNQQSTGCSACSSKLSMKWPLAFSSKINIHLSNDDLNCCVSVLVQWGAKQFLVWTWGPYSHGDIFGKQEPRLRCNNNRQKSAK